MRKTIPTELWYKSYFKTKILDKKLAELYDRPPLPPKLDQDWEPAQFEPKPLTLTDEDRIEGTAYYDYIAISSKYFATYGTHLNRAEVQLVIKQAPKTVLAKKEYTPNAIVNCEELATLFTTMSAMPIEQRKDFYTKNIIPLL